MIKPTWENISVGMGLTFSEFPFMYGYSYFGYGIGLVLRPEKSESETTPVSIIFANTLSWLCRKEKSCCMSVRAGG